ncbi:MAG: DUF3108 domain-containing protein [Alphaproteobacteria bacterium]|nr:DUF3108 domain-containing protein [Alphaproteobacteria bacterium]
MSMFPLRQLLSLAPALIGLLGVDHAQAEPFQVKYSVHLIGLPLGSAGLNGSIDPDTYKVEANARLSGIAAVISNSKGAAVSTGSLDGRKPAPATYATTSSSSVMTRTIRMALNGGNVRAVDISPPIEEPPDRIPVTETQRRGIVDPLSALLMPIGEGEGLMSPSSCNRTIPIYDGFTRFDVVLSYSGTKQVKIAGYNGPVIICAARYVPISGHRPNRHVTEFMAQNKEMEVWLAPLATSRVLVPYKISVATLVGTTVIEAKEMSLGAQPKSTTAKR